MKDVKKLPLTFKDPYKNIDIIFHMVDVEKIIIPTIERSISEPHVKRLAESIEKIGFVEPITLLKSTEDDKFEVINGQHRLLAAKILGISSIPAIILPSYIKDYIISLNIEKVPTLRDKAHQAYEIFNAYLKNKPDIKETELEAMVEQAYYITIGIIIEKIKDEKFPGYAFEKVLKKVDLFLDDTLKNAKKEREKRAKVLLEAKDVLNKRYEELGFKNALYKEAIVSKAIQSIYGKHKRNLTDDFYQTFEKLIKTIPSVQVSEEDLEET
ncbi:MAG: ParB/RepB/Spo0J family partition protein [Endomicrobia bacterium]|nr:ParB/RepB/Spo0J family partition protein [Endomicrobiia bacterium]